MLSAVREMGTQPTALPFAVRGRTVSLSAGLEVVDETYLTT